MLAVYFGNSEKINEVKLLIKRILLFTISAELIGALLLCIRFVPMFGPLVGTGQALFTSISAFCNCGFDLLGANSLKEFSTDYLVLSVIAVQTLLGSLGFIVLNELLEKSKVRRENKLYFRKSWLTLSTHTKLVLAMLVIMIIVGTFGIFVFEFNNPCTLGKYSIGDKMFISLFHGISARTTGMAAIELINMTNSGKFFTIILMFIGGSPGGTAGGIKTTTFAILMIAMIRTISNNKSVNVFRRQISEENIKQAITVLVSALIIASVAIMVISALNPEIEFIDIMFEVVSALATCGYSLGITASLTTFSKFLIIIIMYIGRVSTITFAMAIVGKKFKQNNLINYPVENINVG